MSDRPPQELPVRQIQRWPSTLAALTGGLAALWLATEIASTHPQVQLLLLITLPLWAVMAVDSWRPRTFICDDDTCRVRRSFLGHTTLEWANIREFRAVPSGWLGLATEQIEVRLADGTSSLLEHTRTRVRVFDPCSATAVAGELNRLLDERAAAAASR